MQSKLKRNLAVGAAAVAALVGAGGTYAATRDPGSKERDAYLGDAAKRLGVSREKLESALSGAFSDRLDAAVKAGHLTRKQADAIKRRVKEKGGPPVLGGGPFLGGPRMFHHRVGGPFRGGVRAAAKYLGLTRAQLRDRLASGKSLAQVAEERGKSVDGLEKAIEDAVRASLDKAVSKKRLTGSQEQRILANLHDRIDDLVRRRPPEHMRFRGGPGPRGPVGPRWGGPPGGP
jgi:DNA-binding phage protein